MTENRLLCAGCVTADTHIDQTRGLEDTARCLDFIIAETIRRRELLSRSAFPGAHFTFSHLGDGYKTAKPTPAEADIMHRLRALRSHDIHSEILVANHDRVESEEFGEQVHAFVDMRNLGGAMDVIEKPTIMPVLYNDVVTGNVPVIAYRLIIPHIKKADAQREGLSYPAMFKKTLDGMVAQVPPGAKIIVMSHFFVREAKVGPCDHVVGGDQLVPLADLVDPRFIAVFLGDVHKAQCLHREKPWVGYCGSIDRIDFGEADDAKGFIYYELWESGIKIEFVPTPARRFVNIVADLTVPHAPGDRFAGMPDSPALVQAWLEGKVREFDTKGAKVKLTVRCGPSLKGAIDDRKLTDGFLAAGAEGVKSVNFDVVTAENRRAPEVTESLSKVDALGHWVKVQAYPEATAQSVMAAGKKIIGAEK